MLLAQRALLRLHRPPEKRLRPGVVAFGLKHGGQVIHAAQRVGMLLAQRALVRLQRPPVQRLRPGVVAFGCKQAARLFTLFSVSGCSLPSVRSFASSARRQAAPPRHSHLFPEARRPGIHAVAACRDAPCPACAHALPRPRNSGSALEYSPKPRIDRPKDGLQPGLSPRLGLEFLPCPPLPPPCPLSPASASYPGLSPVPESRWSAFPPGRWILCGLVARLAEPFPSPVRSV